MTKSPGIYYDLPDPDYRSAEGVSNSMLKRLRKRWSPAHAKATLAKPAEPSAAMMFGKAFHWLILTPGAPCPFKVMPEGQNGRTKEGKAFIESTLAAGLDVLTTDQERRLVLTDKALSTHSLAHSALADGKPEVSVFAPFSLGGTVTRKGRMDFVSTGAAIVDLKTAADCSPNCVGKPDEFSKQLFSLDYDMQAAYYLDLWNAAQPDDPKTDFVFIVFDWDEEVEMVGIRVLRCDETVIKSGRDKYIEALAKWIECESSGHWPGYSESVEMLSIPEYAARKYSTI